MCVSGMEGTAAPAGHSCAGSSLTAMRCTRARGFDPSGSAPACLSPADQGLLCTLWEGKTSLPCGRCERECVGTWQSTDERNAAVWVMSLLFSQNGLIAEMGKLFIRS